MYFGKFLALLHEYSFSIEPITVLKNHLNFEPTRKSMKKLCFQSIQFEQPMHGNPVGVANATHVTQLNITTQCS